MFPPLSVVFSASIEHSHHVQLYHVLLYPVKLIRTWTWVTSHHESDWSLLIDVYGDVGALDPGVGAEVSQSYIRVPGRQVTPFLFKLFVCMISLQEAFAVSGSYRGTNESVFCSVVGSSSNSEAMSFPWATATSLYLILSPWERLLLRLVSIYREVIG